MFKEFGVRLSFTPTVLGGDLVHLKVRPEVSSLDFANAVNIDGFRIPALSTRRTETEVELRDGQTFAIAGLLNNTLTNTMSKIPGIGDIPVLGNLFKSKAHQKNQTELVVMITPVIMQARPDGCVRRACPRSSRPISSAPNKTYSNPSLTSVRPGSRRPSRLRRRSGREQQPDATGAAPAAKVAPSRPRCRPRQSR